MALKPCSISLRRKSICATYSTCDLIQSDDSGGFPGHMPRANPRSYDDYLKAYSMAMLPGRERENVSYGGKSTRHPYVYPWITRDLTPFRQLLCHLRRLRS